jgi:hypothetical protein
MDVVSEREDSRPSLPAVVKEYLDGKSVNEIAAKNRVSRRTIYNWLLAGLGDEGYRELVTQCLVGRVADADEELEAARLSKDPVRVSAARDTCRFARMDFERRRPGLYGPKQEVEVKGKSNFTVVLLERPSAAGEPREVDVTPVAVLEGPGREVEKDKEA